MSELNIVQALSTTAEKVKDYIDEKSRDVDIDMSTVDEHIGFINPEMFGAKGDGTTDDTQAVQQCVHTAESRHVKVIGSQSYLISQPLEIFGNLFDVSINRIKYTGTDAAVIVDGAQNKVKINYIISNGVGIRLTTVRTVGGTGHHNDIEVTNIESQKHCYEISAINRSISSNKFTFCKLNPNEAFDCINVSCSDGVYTSQNQYNGGQCISGNWAIHGTGSSDVANEIHLEGVKNGYYLTSGEFRVNGGRWCELINSNWGNGHGIYTGGIFDTTIGTLFHMAPRNGEMTISNQGTRLYPSSFNFEDVATESYIWPDTGSVDTPKKNEGYTAIIHAPLRSLSGEIFAEEFIIFCNNIIIKKPRVERIMTINTSNPEDYTTWKTDMDYCKWLRIYSDFYVNENCEFTLPPSYDAIGYNTFRVHQSVGKHIVLKDWRGTQVFDGSQYGDGDYEIQITISDATREDTYNNQYQVWNVKRISTTIDSTTFSNMLEEVFN